MKVKIKNNTILTDEKVTEKNMKSFAKKVIAYMRKYPELVTPEIKEQANKFVAFATALEIARS